MLLSLLATVLLIWLLLQTELVQNIIVGKVTKRLSKDLNTEVRIRHVSFAFFNRMNLEGTLVRDRSKDTLLYANNIKVRVTDWFFLQDTLVLKLLDLRIPRSNCSAQILSGITNFLSITSPLLHPKKQIKANWY